MPGKESREADCKGSEHEISKADVKKALEDLQMGMGGGMALQTAIAALNKQLPKKPMAKYADWWRCRCGLAYGVRYNYCPQCGQRADWEDKDEARKTKQ